MREIRKKFERHDVVPMTPDASGTYIVKSEKSKLATVAKGLRSVGRGYVNALNDPDIQNALGRLYRSNMWNLTGDEQYREERAR